MSFTTLDIAVVAAYFIGMLLFAGLVRRGRSFSSYSVADRSVPASISFATLAATFIGPGYSLGLAGKGASSGFFFMLPFAMFSLQTILVGLFVAPRLHNLHNCHSLGDAMGRFYGRGGKLLTGIVSVGLCLGLFAVMARAGGVVISNGFNVSMEFGIVLVSVVGMTYALTGGLRAIIATEAVQFGILLLVFSVLALCVAGRVESFEVLQSSAVDATRRVYDATSSAELFGLCVTFFLGEALIPPYANRALAADSGRTSRRAFVVAGVFSLFWFLMIVVIGYVGGLVAPGASSAPNDQLLVAVAHDVLPSGLWGLFLVGVAAVVMSSQESVLNAGAVSLVRDLVVPLKGQSSERAQLLLARVATTFLGIVGIVIALRAPSIIRGLLICYTLWAPSVLPPLVWGAFGLPTNPMSGFLWILGGAAGAVLGLVTYGSDAVMAPLCFGFGAAALGGGLGVLLSRADFRERGGL